jgi:hypothetical protein
MAATDRTVEATEGDWLTLEGLPFDTGWFWGAWILAILAYGVGDVMTTVALVWSTPAYVEANPIIVWAIDAFGGGGFLGVKLLSFYAALGLSIWGGVGDEDHVLFYGPPVALALFGVVTTALNLNLLFG